MAGGAGTVWPGAGQRGARISQERQWDHPASSHDIKKPILRTVLKEIIVSSVGDSVRFIVHWQGGDHSELSLR